MTTAMAAASPLTREQRAAVEWGEGPLMVLAGAGTGKTTVVVERVRYLLDRGATLAPENILVLTYNVRAAAELTRRLERALGIERASRLWVHNFHSFGHRLLTTHRTELGLADSGAVLDHIGQVLLLRELRPQLRHFLYHDLAVNPNPTLGRFAEMISRAKDELVTPEEFAAFVKAKQRAFVFEFGAADWDEALDSLRQRRAENQLAPIWEVRRQLRDRAEAARAADRAARRQASGVGNAVGWGSLTADQQDLATGLKETFLRDGAAFDVLRLQEEGEVYALYQRKLHERGLVDFGEQQQRAIELLTEYPNLLLRYQRQFRHVLVDEFQDANIAQVLLLELVGRGPDKPDNVVVVGDDDQSIYRFRGASYAAFARFEERFGQPPAWASDRPATRVARLPLLENRRSSEHILRGANRLIAHNEDRLKKNERLHGIHGDGEPVEVVYAPDEAAEADAIVERIGTAFDALPQPKRWSDVAVLYRRHRHREAIVERLRRAGIPYVLVGGTGLFLQPEIRDLEAALRVCANPDDSVSFTRLLTAGPWRFDAAEILKITRAADWDGRAVFQAAAELHRAEGDDAPEPALRAKVAHLFAVLDDLVPRARRDGPFTILEEYLVPTNLLHDLIATETPEAQRTVLAVARLLRFAADWQREHPRESLADFVAYLDLYQEVGGDLDTDGPAGLDVEGVQLMTIYQAKGLECEVVIVPRLIEDHFPDTRGENLLIPVELLKQAPPEEFRLAEERRLLFVAMTRARRRLILSAIDGPTGRPRPSRFAEEVAPEAADSTDSTDLIGGGSSPSADSGGRFAKVASLPPPSLAEGSAPPATEPADAAAADSPTPTTSTTPPDVFVTRLAPAPDAEVEVVAPPTADDAAAQATPVLERLMPVPAAFERRYQLRRRAVELIGALEAASAQDPPDPDARAALLDELVAVARAAADEAEEARRNGLDPVTLRVLSRHAPAGETLLALTGPPGGFSHSAFSTYQDLPAALRLRQRLPHPDRGQGLLRVRERRPRRLRGVGQGAQGRPRRGSARARLRGAAPPLRRALRADRLRRPAGRRALRAPLGAEPAPLLRERAGLDRGGGRHRGVVRVRAPDRRRRRAGPPARQDRPHRPPPRRLHRGGRLQDRAEPRPGRCRPRRAALDLRSRPPLRLGARSRHWPAAPAGEHPQPLLHRIWREALHNPHERAARHPRRPPR